MAQRSILILEDDLEGGEAAETVTFGLDGVTYEIDLNAANAQRLRSDLALWTGHGRRVTGRRASGRKARGGPSAGDIRSWAQSQGMQVSARGRVPAEIREAYDRAH